MTVLLLNKIECHMVKRILGSNVSLLNVSAQFLHPHVSILWVALDQHPNIAIRPCTCTDVSSWHPYDHSLLLSPPPQLLDSTSSFSDSLVAGPPCSGFERSTSTTSGLTRVIASVLLLRHHVPSQFLDQIGSIFKSVTSSFLLQLLRTSPSTPTALIASFFTASVVLLDSSS